MKKVILLTLASVLALTLLLPAATDHGNATTARITTNDDHDFTVSSSGEFIVEVADAGSGVFGVVKVYVKNRETWRQLDINGDYTIDSNDQFAAGFAIRFPTGSNTIRLTTSGFTTAQLDASIKEISIKTR